MAKRKVELNKSSDFSKYIGKNCITHHGYKGVIVGYAIILNLFIIGLLEETKHSWMMNYDANLDYDIIDSDDIILVHSPMFKAYCYDGRVTIEE